MPDAISQTHLDDDNLIANGLQGDQEAFNVLFSKYRRLLYSLASRVLHSHDEAEDAVQNSSLLAFCKLRSFKHEGAFRSWLIRILVNEAVSLLRQRKNRLPKFSDPSSCTEVREIVECLPSPGPDPEQALVSRQSALALAKKMSDLGAPQRSVLLLCGVEGYTTEDVSVMLNVTPTAVRTRLFRVRKKIAAALRPSGFADRVT
jgi:RNA polymerase sigma-70 factor (ECF subfamily)